MRFYLIAIAAGVIGLLISREIVAKERFELVAGLRSDPAAVAAAPKTIKG